MKNACEPNPFGNIEECMTAAELQILVLVKDIINNLKIKEVSDVWHDARKTLPEDGIEQIICIKEDGLAVLTIGKIINGTTKWAYLNELLNLYSTKI